MANVISEQVGLVLSLSLILILDLDLDLDLDCCYESSACLIRPFNIA